DSDKSPGYKFSEQEMRGIPLRIEIGPRDIQNNVCVIVRRDTFEKTECPIDKVAETVSSLLETVQNDMLERARRHLEEETFEAKTPEEFARHFENQNGFVKAMWCGDRACEDKIKEMYGVTSRCIPFHQEEIAGTCVCCGKPAKKMVYWAKAY
ncbi:MAG TPA: proline--tRNA ligase, partial [Lachnospiraceae bacterium]|nr:proline--tRNA ligase [Lachnospiraceae bacterium]